MIKEAANLIFEQMPAVVYAVVALFGILVGSFLNVCIYRLPKGESIVVVPSHCMNCGKKLHWYELFPLFSWLALRGKCLGCKAPISPQYPLIEAFNGFLWVLVFSFKGISFDTILCQGLFSVLLVLSVIDARTKEIPNSLSVIIAVLGVIRAVLYHQNVLDIVLGPVVMFTAFLLIILLSGGRAMGGGDMKLCTAVGLFLGLKLTVLGVAIGCVVGSVIHISLMIIKKVGRELAFGPYLSVGFAVSAIIGNKIIEIYLSLFGF